MSDIPDDAVSIGTIEIHYYLAADGTPIISTGLPDVTDIPLVTQLGMLEMARDTVWRVAMGEAPEGDDDA